jgi:hypothetical protein
MAPHDTVATGPHDFDFFNGSWTIASRRLKARHVGSDDWDEFPGFTRCRRLLGGVANVDENVFPTRGFSGVSFRSFDHATGDWSIWWVNSRSGRLEPPVSGRFIDGRGEFFGDDLDGGRPVRVRFIWSAITPVSARWEQAFSVDGGRNWETNWIMTFTRTAF